MGHPRQEGAAFPPFPKARGPRGRKGEKGTEREEKAHAGSTHLARRAGPDHPRQRARSRGEGLGGGEARAPVWKYQRRFGATPGLKGNGSPFLSLTRTHQHAHSPKVSRGPRRASRRHRTLSVSITAPTCSLIATQWPRISTGTMAAFPQSWAPWLPCSPLACYLTGPVNICICNPCFNISYCFLCLPCAR